ncbi:hypothetical protein ACRS6Y_05755 [Bacillus cytotoxicus]|uniref:Group-specific protein n=2 Tax=Bacillus cytotoxicus TaxID=580165 RepID=A0AAX2CJV5_9BACI|nr:MULTISPECIES: hypothetical protein [Bacillus cereus group]ABS22972.1 conserved hypothetical membrane spanning protein [Bacillus cytotoxicus NVH 391-98]AWC29627.1 hypothetical protein CG483_015655 [Bacillus cytotoxicus]AWC41759.1 hypothetical protein CG480_015655 [Bacillus cytotoxicus]AWC45603.1 hypothetical protein CG479_014605 [Bacillus cytotoxicus]AWC49690.1 hypothetical protein CG478_015655 [Bacillus cytotoxicus]
MNLIMALIIGVTCGAIPAILGAIMEELEIGMLGFVASSVSALLFGLYGAIPVSILFAFYIVRHARVKQFAPNHVAQIIPFPIERSRRASNL